MNSALVPGALIEECREERLERWMEQYGNAIFHTCFITLSDVHLAEDAMQDTFVKAWRAMEQFEQKFSASEKAWLLRIALNTCRDYRRGAWMRRVKLTAEMESLAAPQIAVSPDERELFLDVMAMPDKYRQMIVLHYYQNLTLLEIGQVLHISIYTEDLTRVWSYAARVGVEKGDLRAAVSWDDWDQRTGRRLVPDEEDLAVGGHIWAHDMMNELCKAAGDDSGTNWNLCFNEDNVYFYDWSLEEKAALSQTMKPKVDAFLAANPDYAQYLLERGGDGPVYYNVTRHAYGLPDEKALSQDAAQEIAYHAI